MSIPAIAAPDSALSAGDRSAVIQTLATKVRENYVYPDVGERVAAALLKKDAAGGYASAASAGAFSAALSKDLREFGDDKHFRAFPDERFRERPAGNTAPSRAQMDEMRDDAARLGYGIEKVQRLPGNVGYLEVRGFGPTEFVGPAFSQAMSLLAGTDALILDLRRNGGGRPASVAYLMSMFFPLGDERHLNDLYDRPTDSTQQYWTLPSVGPRYDKPVYVLTSARTFSGGEECAYDFQTQKRAILVGETTGGGANPVGPFSVGHGIVVAIPVGRAINPVTKTSWEHTGVKPDIAVPAAQAQQTAYVAILRKLAAETKDPGLRDHLQHTLALAEKGETEPPVYTPRP
ncbi:MAG: S41 family peptidase [Ramlibacter sp.]